MAFTSRSVTHTFKNADGTPASGSLIFTPSGVMTNGTTTVVPAAVTANLDASGDLSQSLTCNTDTSSWSLTSTAISGSFELEVTGGTEGPLTTDTLVWNVTAAVVEAALQALPGLAGVTCSGGPVGSEALVIADVPGGLSIAVIPSFPSGSASLTQTDTGTVPAAPLNVQWRVDLRILGSDPSSLYFTLPPGEGSIDLGSLLPSTQQVG